MLGENENYLRNLTQIIEMKIDLEQEGLQVLAETRIRPEHKTIKLIVSDIEGCLNLDEKTYDHDALAWIRRANELALPDNPLPFITVASGRQHAFVEAIVRMITGRMPAIFENGCGLFFPARSLYDEYEWHPALDDYQLRTEFEVVNQVVERLTIQSAARRVIGKEVLISLHPSSSMTVGELRRSVEEALSEAGVCAAVTSSASAVDIAPCGIDKAAGLKWLVSNLDGALAIELSNVCGIGDSRGDISFLRIAGLAAAPANAAIEVKELAGFVSRWPDGQGVASVIRECISINNQERSARGEHFPLVSARLD